TINIGGKQRLVHVPVEMAAGVRYEAIDGDAAQVGQFFRQRSVKVNVSASRTGGGAMGGAPFSNTPVNGISVAPMAAGRSTLNGLSRDYAVTPRAIKPEMKIAKILRTKQGRVEVQVWMQILTPELLKTLGAKGLKIEQHDDK